MPRLRALRPLTRSLVAAFVLAAAAAPAAGQTGPFNSNGFESPTFTITPSSNIVGQQGFQATPANTAASIQTATVFAGTQALQISGPALVNDTTFAGGNFWYRSSPFATAYNPVGSNTPIVRVEAQTRTSGDLVLATDIPFAGFHLEGYTSLGIQQSITPVMVNLNGGVTVFTNLTVGGPNQSVATADTLLPREQWNQLAVELNFTTQTFRVFVLGQSTPVQFVTNGSGQPITPITDVPFRNSFGSTERVAEVGMVAFYGRDISGGPVQPLNNFFMDDFVVTASPVPEPGFLVAVGFAGVVAGRWYRRRRAAAGPA
jgi:hypothetical protein